VGESRRLVRLLATEPRKRVCQWGTKAETGKNEELQTEASNFLKGGRGLKFSLTGEGESSSPGKAHHVQAFKEKRTRDPTTC